ncbi:MAG: helix-turn-helix domain-containing protein, partial [Reyranella sp.]
MTTRLDSRYTAAQLGQLSGVGERTVRYYVCEGLIDPPNGRGRGAHFDYRHLGQLQRVRFLQEAGLDHAAIRQHGEEIEAALAKRGVARR